MKLIQIILGIFIVIGILLLGTQKFWVPSLVNKILEWENSLQLTNFVDNQSPEIVNQRPMYWNRSEFLLKLNSNMATSSRPTLSCPPRTESNGYLLAISPTDGPAPLKVSFCIYPPEKKSDAVYYVLDYSDDTPNKIICSGLTKYSPCEPYVYSEIYTSARKQTIRLIEMSSLVYPHETLNEIAAIPVHVAPATEASLLAASCELNGKMYHHGTKASDCYWPNESNTAPRLFKLEDYIEKNGQLICPDGSKERIIIDAGTITCFFNKWELMGAYI